MIEDIDVLENLRLSLKVQNNSGNLILKNSTVRKSAYI